MTGIIDRLEANTVIAAAVGSHIYANYTEYLGDCIVYSYNTLNNDKCVHRLRLKMVIIAQSLATCDAVEAAIKDTIVSLGDDTIEGYTHIAQNGGGDMFDVARNMNHRTMYFDVIKRGS